MVTCVVKSDLLLTPEEEEAWTDEMKREAAVGILHGLHAEADYSLAHRDNSGPTLVETVTMRQQANLSGTWKLVKNDNYQPFLSLQGEQHGGGGGVFWSLLI